MQQYTKDWLEELCKDSYSYAEVLRKAGRKPAGGSQATLKKKIEEYNIDISHFTGQLWSKGKTAKDDERIKKMASNFEKYTDETIFQVGSASRRVVRAYILRHNSIPYECKTCGNKGEWFGKTMPLELHHINGVNNDTASSGADITFGQVRTAGGDNYNLYSSTYDSAYSITFQVGKNPCKLLNQEEMYFSPIEASAIQAWLCQDEYCKFKNTRI